MILRQALAVLHKDILLEWRGRSRAISVVLFGVVTLLLFSFAVGPDSEALRANSPGFLVLALLLSSTLALSESFRVETDNGCLEGLLLLPVEPSALYFGKAVSNTLFLMALAPVLVPVAFVLYTVQLDAQGVAGLMLIWLLTAGGLSAPGTLYAGMTSRLRGQDVLLPLLLYPLVVPVLLASVKGVDLLINGDPMGQLSSWILLLTAFNAIYWSLCGLLFPYIVEE